MQPRLAPAWSRRFVGNPVFAAIVAAIAALVGLLGSVYQSEIAGSFPLTLTSGFSLRSLIFWVALFGLAYAVYLRQVVDDEARGKLLKTTEAAEETSRRIEEFVQTLPPRAFQSELARAVAAVHNAVSSALPRTATPESRPEELMTVIRAVLHSIASLALIYDDQPLFDGQPARYSANVMVFAPIANGNIGRINFFPDEYDRAQLAGVLTLRQELSATSESADEPDADVPSIHLPVPPTALKGGRWIALPGAPLAYLTRETAGYTDTSNLAEWCREKGNFPPSVQDELNDYFLNGAGREIRSFVSRRLGDVGVLNVHANKPDLLGGRNERRETFQALLTPILQDLEDAVAALQQLENQVSLRGTAPPANIESEDAT